MGGITENKEEQHQRQIDCFFHEGHQQNNDQHRVHTMSDDYARPLNHKFYLNTGLAQLSTFYNA